MASQPVLTVCDGVIEIPQELRNDPRLKEGARLRIVSAADKSVLLEPICKGSPANGDWRRLRGSLAHLEVKLTDEMDKERVLENERDAQLMSGETDR